MKTKLSLRVEPYFKQILGEEGYYDAHVGFMIAGLDTSPRKGDILYYFQQVFGRESEAEAKLEELCGSVRNGFNAYVDVSSKSWEFFGCSY